MHLKQAQGKSFRFSSSAPTGISGATSSSPASVLLCYCFVAFVFFDLGRGKVYSFCFGAQSVGPEALLRSRKEVFHKMYSLLSWHVASAAVISDPESRSVCMPPLNPAGARTGTAVRKITANTCHTFAASMKGKLALYLYTLQKIERLFPIWSGVKSGLECLGAGSLEGRFQCSLFNLLSLNNLKTKNFTSFLHIFSELLLKKRLS